MTINKWCIVAVTVCGCACLIALTVLLLQIRNSDAVIQAHSVKLLDNTNKAVTELTAPCPVIHPTGEPCGGAVVQLLKTVDTLNTTITGVNSLLFASTNTVNSLNRTVGIVNKNCDVPPCGTLADVAKTLNTVRLTAGQVEIAANHEDRNLAAFDTREATLFADTHDVMVSANADLAQFQTLLNDPQIPVIEQNVADITKTSSHMLVTADAVETKLTKCTLHPTFGCTFKADAIFGAQVGGYILSGLH